MIPPPSLAGDLGVALGSMEHVDVRFIAGDRPVYAHRAVLSCGSEYFAAMFRFRYVCRRVSWVDSRMFVAGRIDLNNFSWFNVRVRLRLDTRLFVAVVMGLIHYLAPNVLGFGFNSASVVVKLLLW